MPDDMIHLEEESGEGGGEEGQDVGEALQEGGAGPAQVAQAPRVPRLHAPGEGSHDQLPDLPEEVGEDGSEPGLEEGGEGGQPDRPAGHPEAGALGILGRTLGHRYLGCLSICLFPCLFITMFVCFSLPLSNL